MDDTDPIIVVAKKSGRGVNARKKSAKELNDPLNRASSMNGDEDDKSIGDDVKESVSEKKIPESHQIQVTDTPHVDESHDPLINNMQTLMHIFKSNIGTGILALPIAVKHAGLWTGLAGILCIGGIAVHCMHMLLNCSRLLCIRTGSIQLDYAGVMEMSVKTGPKIFHRFFGAVRPFVDLLLIFTQLGACCVYIVFIATNIQMVLNFFVPSSLDVRVYEIGVMVLLLPFVCIRNLRLLAPFSAFANVLTITGLLIIIQYIVQRLPDTSSRPFFTSLTEIPLFFGTAIFTVEGIGLVLPLRNTMEKPQDFGGWAGVLNLGMTGTVCLYATIGFYGYLKFGDDIQSSITLSLPDNALYMSVRLMFAISILITYNIQFYVPLTLLWPRVLKRLKTERSRHYGEYVFRMGVVIMTFGISAAIPHVDLLISLIGAVACSFLALILPAFIEVVTLIKEPASIPKLTLVKDILIFLFGVFGTVIGTYTSIAAIIDTF